MKQTKQVDFFRNRVAGLTADSFIPASLNEGLLADEVRRLRGIIDEVHSWVVCGCIAPPEDMAQNFERITVITAPDYYATPDEFDI